ncbi:MAG: ABC transporter ATP-binding protein [Candidatus Bathyarchaeia archaeon]
MVILKCKDLVKRFGGIRALSNLTFEVNDDEIFGIIGPNGSGKTTLFNVITGVYRPDAGSIEYKGRSIVGLSPHEISRMGIIRAYQIPRPFTRLTILENCVVAALSTQKISYNEAVKYSLEALELLKLGDLINVPAGSLLPFQLKRLEMARALACRPKLLLLDEPAAGMRKEEISYLAELIDKIFNEGTKIILVEHRMELITRVAKRVMVMYRGTKLFEGEPKEVLSAPEVIEAYLGEGIK